MSSIALNKFAKTCTFRYGSVNYDFEMDSGRIIVVPDKELDKIAGGEQYTTLRGYYLQYDLSFRYMRRKSSVSLRSIVSELFSGTVEFKPFPDATSYAVKLLNDDVTFAEIDRQIMKARVNLSLITTNRLTSLPTWLDNNPLTT